MTSRFLKIPRARTCALAAAMAVAGSLATAAPGFAIAPVAGTACVPGTSQGDPNGGKISGRGSTFQATAFNNAFIPGYTADVCGPVTAQFTGDPAGTNMVAYNYTGNAGTGSGQGQKAASCRSDAFGGTDLPYTETILHTQLNGAAGATGGCPTIASPFTPGLPYPAAGDTTAPVMAFPVAGGAVGIGFNLGTTSCPAPATPPTALNLTSQEMSDIFSGAVNVWDDPELTANNPGLAGCTGAIQRVVRSDNSGTTGIVMTYLSHVNGGTLCDGASTWAGLAANNPNTTWPEGCTAAGTGGSVAPASVKKAGTPGIINCVEGVDTGTGCGDGSIGYGELGVWGSQAPSATLANLQTAASTGGTPVYISPGSGSTGSNCNLGSNGLPGGATPNDSVSLNGAPKGSGNSNWASDASPNKEDLTFQGTNYPICGLTFDFVYSNLHIETNPNPFNGLTNNQRRTLYSFFTYVLSPAAQARLNAAGYDPLPTGWLTTLRTGYQSNF